MHKHIYDLKYVLLPVFISVFVCVDPGWKKSIDSSLHQIGQ